MIDLFTIQDPKTFYFGRTSARWTIAGLTHILDKNLSPCVFVAVAAVPNAQPRPRQSNFKVTGSSPTSARPISELISAVCRLCSDQYNNVRRPGEEKKKKKKNGIKSRRESSVFVENNSATCFFFSPPSSYCCIVSFWRTF